MFVLQRKSACGYPQLALIGSAQSSPKTTVACACDDHRSRYGIAMLALVGPIVAFASAIVVTIVLLGIGLTVGYRLGLQSALPHGGVPPENPELRQRERELAQQFE